MKEVNEAASFFLSRSKPEEGFKQLKQMHFEKLEIDDETISRVNTTVRLSDDSDSSADEEERKRKKDLIMKI